jgi:hypothetical protein
MVTRVFAHKGTDHFKTTCCIICIVAAYAIAKRLLGGVTFKSVPLPFKEPGSHKYLHYHCKLAMFQVFHR